jgi:hypothetical protein
MEVSWGGQALGAQRVSIYHVGGSIDAHGGLRRLQVELLGGKNVLLSPSRVEKNKERNEKGTKKKKEKKIRK